MWFVAMPILGALPDYCSVSFHVDQFGLINGYSPEQFSDILLNFFEQSGLHGVKTEPCIKGLYGYRLSFEILRPCQLFGELFPVGRLAYTPSTIYSNSTSGLFFSLSSNGCIGLDFRSLFIKLLPFNPVITRVDFAVDYFNSSEFQFGYYHVKQLYLDGAFSSRGRHPRFQEIAPQSIDPYSSSLQKVAGWTFYVGKRGNSRFMRAYEKGLQLSFESINNPYPDWFRVEVELRNADCVIPLTVFDDFDAATIGAYSKFFNQLPTPLHIKDINQQINLIKQDFKTPEFEVSLEHLIFHAKRSYGSLINVLKNRLDKTADEIVEILLPDDPQKKPSRLFLPSIPFNSLTQKEFFYA
jgi:DNA relaxase NicK